MSSRFEQKKKQMDELGKNCEYMKKENEDLKSQVFKKQS